MTVAENPAQLSGKDRPEISNIKEAPQVLDDGEAFALITLRLVKPSLEENSFPAEEEGDGDVVVTRVTDPEKVRTLFKVRPEFKHIEEEVIQALADEGRILEVKGDPASINKLVEDGLL